MEVFVSFARKRHKVVSSHCLYGPPGKHSHCLQQSQQMTLNRQSMSRKLTEGPGTIDAAYMTSEYEVAEILPLFINYELT